MSKGVSNFFAGKDFADRLGGGGGGERKAPPVTLARTSIEKKADPKAPHALKPYNPTTRPHAGPRVVEERGEQTNFGERPTKRLMRGGEPV